MSQLTIDLPTHVTADEARAGAASDVDVAIVRTDDDNALRRIVDLTKKLETAIDRPVHVTLIAVRGTDPRLLGQVLRHGECLFARDEAIRVEFETRARSKYLDSTDPCAGRLTASPIDLLIRE